MNADLPYQIRQTVELSPGTYMFSFYMTERICGPANQKLDFGVVKGSVIGFTSSSSKISASHTTGFGWELKSTQFVVDLSGSYTVLIASTTQGSCGPVIDDTSLVKISSATTGNRN